jgi:hypothetical protein
MKNVPQPMIIMIISKDAQEKMVYRRKRIESN